MTFLQPFLLWGALAVIAPIIIHFWHQKRGKPLAWAATQWLIEKNQQQQRGLKLDNIPLLIVRCLLLVLLAILLSQPILNSLKNKAAIQPVHLIQPNALVTAEFRFELEEAAKRGEKLYWINDSAEPVGQSDQLPAQPTFTPLLLQTAIDKLRQEDAELHLYLVNNEELATLPAIYVPGRFRLHTVIDSVNKSRNWLVMKGNQKLFVNRAGRLANSAVPDPAVRFQPEPAHSGPLRVLLDYRNPQEGQTVTAALDALADVYGLAFSIDRKPTNAVYDWVLTDRAVANPQPQTLYIVSGMMGYSTAPNVVYAEQPFTPKTDERVATGQLPEWLGEQLIRHYGLETNSLPLNRRALKTLFVTANRPDRQPQTLVHNLLVLLFVVLLIVERWLALTKNA